MDRKMLINARQAEECRIAIVDDKTISELEVESYAGKKLKGNIYKAKIARIEPSLQAAFIDIGTQRNGFLQINDVHPSHFKRTPRNPNQPRIQDVLEAGQDLVVQVVKEERDQKGATLTTYLSLPGRYTVLMPGSDRGGVSRKIADSEQRSRLRKLAEELEIPVGVGLIVRTAGLNRSLSDLSRDLSLQLKLWERIVKEAQDATTPTILYKESDLATRVVRDYFTPEIREIIVDDKETFAKVREFVDQVMPRYRSRIKLYDQEGPIFANFGIEEQVAQTLRSEVHLKSGGSIVIESLEALTAIDVNSGKATAGGNIEETAYRTNLEAADEIARQLRLRDLGGLIVIDFIDMLDRKHRAAVERRLEDATKSDKARVEVGRLSRFGLLEMSRQRLRASLTSQSHADCPVCLGMGKIRNAELVALEALRKIQAAVIIAKVSSIKVRLSAQPAFMLLNSRRNELVELETKFGAKISVIPDGRLRPDDCTFEMDNIQAPPEPPPAEEEEEDEDLLDEPEFRGARKDDDGDSEDEASETPAKG
jgi:ribonuclease E